MTHKATFKQLDTGAHYAIVEYGKEEVQTRYRGNLNDVRLDVEMTIEMLRLRDTQKEK